MTHRRSKGRSKTVRERRAERDERSREHRTAKRRARQATAKHVAAHLTDCGGGSNIGGHVWRDGACVRCDDTQPGYGDGPTPDEVLCRLCGRPAQTYVLCPGELHYDFQEDLW